MYEGCHWFEGSLYLILDFKIFFKENLGSFSYNVFTFNISS